MKRAALQSGFTLIELLVVIAIIGILASLLLAALARVKTTALRSQARAEASAIALALSSFESKYGRLPALPGMNSVTNDVTFGWADAGSAPTTVIPTNAGIIAILLDEVAYGNGQPTPNQGHALNPLRHVFLNARRTSDVGAPGIGPDGEYRDPWGQPYVISLDYSQDDGCRDALYSRAGVSQKEGHTGFHGLFNRAPGGTTDDFESVGRVLVWSKGEDRRAARDQKANQGENKNNLLHWQ